MATKKLISAIESFNWKKRMRNVFQLKKCYVKNITFFRKIQMIPVIVSQILTFYYFYVFKFLAKKNLICFDPLKKSNSITKLSSGLNVSVLYGTSTVKFMFSKKSTKNYKTFTVNLTFTYLVMYGSCHFDMASNDEFSV